MSRVVETLNERLRSCQSESWQKGQVEDISAGDQAGGEKQEEELFSPGRLESSLSWPKGQEEDIQEAGPTAVVQQFVEQINQYSETWENRDESNNFDQRHDVELARKSVFPIVEAGSVENTQQGKVVCLISLFSDLDLFCQ